MTTTGLRISALLFLITLHVFPVLRLEATEEPRIISLFKEVDTTSRTSKIWSMPFSNIKDLPEMKNEAPPLSVEEAVQIARKHEGSSVDDAWLQRITIQQPMEDVPKELRSRSYFYIVQFVKGEGDNETYLTVTILMNGAVILPNTTGL